MTLAPWEYLFLPFNHHNFPDLFHPTWIVSAVLLVVLGVLYGVAQILQTAGLAHTPASVSGSRALRIC